MFTFEKASVARHRVRARVALCGPSGSGKTFTALQIAAGLGQRVAVLDTERGSAAMAADRFDFHVLQMEDASPRATIKAIEAAEDAGFEVLIIDSLSHAWMGKGGALEMVDVAQRRFGGNTLAAWREVTPLHNAMMDAILRSRCHVIATLRTRTEVVLQDQGGTAIPVKVGLEPLQCEGIEYEFDIVGELDHEHTLRVTKARCALLDNAVIRTPGPVVGQAIKAWLEGTEPPELPIVPRAATVH